MQKDVIHGDRRSDKRYPFELQLQYQYKDARGVTHAGCGTTTELSRGGIRFVTEEVPPMGVSLEVRIAWPFKLQNVCPLELCVEGPVIRTGDGEAVIRMNDYQFRTCGERSFEAPQDTGAWRVA